MPYVKLLSMIAALLLWSTGLHVDAQGQDWHEIAAALMSPACPGRTLVNCTSAHAEQWRELIRQKLAQGESKEQILQYFVDMGGDAILAAPPKKGFALTAWLLPFFVVLNGAGLIILLAFRWAKRSQTSLPPTSETLSDTPETDPYLVRVREELKNFSA